MNCLIVAVIFNKLKLLSCARGNYEMDWPTSLETIPFTLSRTLYLINVVCCVGRVEIQIEI